MFGIKAKSKRNLRARKVEVEEDDEEDHPVNENVKDEDDEDVKKDTEESSRIARFKEMKSKKSSKNKGLESKDKGRGGGSKAVLSFNDEDEDVEEFRNKKSSQSRKLMKQKKMKKKAKDEDKDIMEEDEEDLAHVHQEDKEVVVKEVPRAPGSPKQWTLTGREAEALHMEEDDEDLSEEEHNGGPAGRPHPFRNILQSGAIPDAATIYEARKRRQAAREGGSASPQQGANRDYIPVSSKNGSSKPGKSRLVREEDEHDDDDEARMSFTGVQSNARDRKSRQEELRKDAFHSSEEEAEDWEEMQIRKAMNKSQISEAGGANQELNDHFSGLKATGAMPYSNEPALPKPADYNLQGIKDRLKKRIESLDEVHRRHQSDADRASDDLFAAQSEIEKLEVKIPEFTDRHKFYQELRGYVTDLLECFDEKIGNIKYLEEKFYKSKGAMTTKIMERRREDLRDQMMELSAGSQQVVQDPTTQAEMAARQRRTAEREGRRRRRVQSRLSQLGAKANASHNDGLSSDDEMSTADQAEVSKARQDISAQARQVLGDVVEDFATLDGVMGRFEAWKKEDPDSYNDAFVSMCMPKVFSPLVRLQMLFWNPFAEHNDIDQQEWYKTLSTYSYSGSESEEVLKADADRHLVSLLVEKVVLPKVSATISSSYDPLSTSQTMKLTSLLTKFVSEYPTLSGESKQMRELLTSAKDRLKSTVDLDMYIPIGYAKQITDNPSGPHAHFSNRQFWTCFKLFRNILSWHGLLSDKILSEMSLTTIMNRYLVTALGLSSDANDALNKCKHIVAALPKSWLSSGNMKQELSRLSGYLVQLGNGSKGGGREFIQEVVNLLRFLGCNEESEALKKKRLK